MGVYKSESLSSFTKKLDNYSSDWDWYDLAEKNGSVYASHYLGKKVFKEDSSGNFIAIKSMIYLPREIEFFNNSLYVVNNYSQVINLDAGSRIFTLNQSLSNFDVLDDFLYVFGNNGGLARIGNDLTSEYLSGISYRISTMSKFKNNYLVFGTSSFSFSISENGIDGWREINLGQGVVYGIEEGNGKILLKTKNGIFHY